MSILDQQTNIKTRYLILIISQFMWTWNSFRLISLVFRIIWFVSAYLFFLRPIRLELIYKLISAFSNIIQKTKTHRHTYIQIGTRYPIALLSKLSYESDITIQSSLVVNDEGNRILKGLFPFYFPFGFRN